MFATSIDITSAHYHLPVASWAQPYLCSNYDGKTYCYRAMPLGLSTAPCTFTLVMRQCIKAIGQRWNVTAVHYLDDLLFLHHDEECLRRTTSEIVRLLARLSWIVNAEKSELEPKQRFRYLGWEWDSRFPSLRLPQDRVKSILHDLRAMRNAIEQQKTTTPRRLARLIGTLSATRLQHRQASLHLHAQDSFKNAAKAVKGWDGETAPLMGNLLQNIEWWERTIRTNQPRLLRFDPPQVSLFTDASPNGWGAHVHLNSINEDVVMHGR
jgi:hypothetical protein